jgi:hypothetical protein
MSGERAIRTAVFAVVVLIGLVLPVTAQAANHWAVVNANGVLARANGDTHIGHPGTGVYVVRFAADVHGCGYIANPGDPGTGFVSTASTASVSRRAGNRDAVLVQMWDQETGTLSDLPFHLVVYCGATSRFAVVGRGGVIARAKHALSARRVSAGRYSVHFDSDVSNCDFTATIGATRSVPVPSPRAIAVASGARTHNVVVTTIGPSGSPASTPFHLAVSCGTMPLRAVVKADGTLARAPGTTTSQRLVIGQYAVVFPRSVRTCAFIATVGDPGSALSTEPLTITTARRSGNPDAAFISVMQPDGTNFDHAFHIVARC